MTEKAEPSKGSSFFFAKKSTPFMDEWSDKEHKGVMWMPFLTMIFFGFLGVCAIKACIRSGEIVFKWIDSFFDWLRDKVIRH